MIFPPSPCAIICFAASCVQTRTPHALTRMMALKLFSSTSMNGSGLLKPALLKKMSSRPKDFDRLPDSSLNLSAVRHIDGDSDGVLAASVQFVGDRFRLRAVEIGDGDLGPLLHQTRRDPFADSLRAAGDDGDFTLKP